MKQFSLIVFVDEILATQSAIICKEIVDKFRRMPRQALLVLLHCYLNGLFRFIFGILEAPVNLIELLSILYIINFRSPFNI